MKKALVQISYAELEQALRLPAGSLFDVRSAPNFLQGLRDMQAFTGRPEPIPPEFDPAKGPVFKLHTVGVEVGEGERIPFVPLANIQTDGG